MPPQPSLRTPLALTPRLDGKPWGGRRLAEFGFALPPSGPIGEALVTASEAIVAAGPLAGRSLGDLARSDPAGLCGGRGLAATGGRPVFPLLIKLIDAAENLSIQDHPDDAGAAAHGPDRLGKTEAWFVLAAAPGAVIYAGLGPGRTGESFAAGLREGQPSMAAFLRQVPARAGMGVLLPAGTIHALGAGILVYEVQQPSDITYRLDDWGRVDAAGRPREMHVEQGIAAMRPSYQPEPIAPVELAIPTGSRQLVAACRYFALERLSLPAGAVIALPATGTPQVLTALTGGATVVAGGETAPLPSGLTIVLPAAAGEAGDATLAATAPVVLLRAWVPDLAADIIVPARDHGASDAAILALGGPTSDLAALIGMD